jgi:MFS transporter, OFA family, oxalate/formate antiporter
MNQRDTRLFRGWQVVAAAFGVLFLSYGLQFSYGVFVSGMADDLGWSRAQTALPYSIYVFVYSAFSAVTGRATDRFGPRPVITAGAALLACGWGTSALVERPWQLDLTLGVVAALGMSVVWVPCNATVSRWFTRRRGTAVAIASSGGSLGNLIVPTLAAALVAWQGWRVTLAGIALFSATFMLLAARYMIRDPESVGLWPDGERPAASAGVVSPGQRLDEVCWTAPFLLLIAIYFLTWVPVFVPFVHAAAYAQDLGLSPLAAGSVISAIGIGGVVGRLSAGVVSDRVGRLPSLLGIFALEAVAFVAFAAARGLGVLWLAAMTFGFSYGGGVALLPALCGDLFGRAHVAAIVGMIFAVAGAPAAIGPYVAGWLFDVTGRYDAAFLCSAALNAGALALACVLMRRSARERLVPG